MPYSLPDRNAETLKSWLENYIPIKRVSRDRFPRFKQVLDEACPDAIQINDRFHLIQNLWNLHDQVMKRILPSKIPKESNETNKKSQPIPLTKQEKRKQENINKKWERALLVKQLKSKGFSNQNIASKLNIDRRTVAADLLKKEPGTGCRRKRSKPINKWKNKVVELEKKGFTVQNIYNTILKEGYGGSCSSVRILVADIRKQRKKGLNRETTIYYSRREIRRVLWQWSFFKDNNKDDKKLVNKILRDYPQMGPYFAFINGFREAISNQDKEELQQLILYEKKRNDSITKGFVTKLLTDFTSTLHACIYKESNGFVEGNVNRLKTIKRMMYGRASFELLRIRVLYSYQ